MSQDSVLVKGTRVVKKKWNAPEIKSQDFSETAADSGGTYWNDWLWVSAQQHGNGYVTLDNPVDS